MFALDANTVIHRFSGKGAVATRLLTIPPSRIAIPAVALFEVERGVPRSHNPDRRRQQLQALLTVCRLLPFDEPAANCAARIQVDLERRCLQIGPMDTLIAATTLALGLPRISRDRKMQASQIRTLW